MSFKSFLSAVGHETGILVKDVFGFLGNPQAQAAIRAGEQLAEDVAGAYSPALKLVVTGGLNLVNAGFQKALDIEAGAAQLSAQAGTGVAKGEAVSAYLASQSSDLLQKVGVSKPTADQVQAISTLVAKFAADFWNAIPAPSSTTPLSPSTGQPPPAQGSAPAA